jgi:hypothetical protein
MVTTPFVLTELQTAVYARLTGDSTLMGMITGVFDIDNVAQGQAMPYISFGNHINQPYKVFRKTNSEGYFLIDIWSDVSREQAYAIMAEVLRLLDGQPLTLSHFNQGMMEYEWSTALFEQNATDWHTGDWHVPIRFHSLIFEP